MPGWPLTGGTVISKTPNSFFFISCESRFQPSSRLISILYQGNASDWRTEIADEVGAQRIGCPFPVRDGVVIVHMNSEPLVTLHTEGQMGRVRCFEQFGMHTLENFSKPPSVSSMVLIHC